MLAVQVADLLILNTYTPPGVEGKAELAAMLSNHFIEDGLEMMNCLWCGDFNDEREEAESTDAIKGFGGKNVTTGEEASRWEGKRNTDCAGTNRPWDAKECGQGDYKISGHIPR